MNMANHPYPHSARPLEQDAQSVRYDITIRVAVDDPAMLWRTAASHLLTFDGVDEAALDETIGPREDPCVENCLSAIFGPAHMPGVRTDIFGVRPAADHARVPRRVFSG